ncbi:hypothetical protein MAPG_07785 [Magnaporthiopsis poae ATCC 64411]|uniref:AAA+ ATPase domain-containing protein n=1 Tax=Magnaporthiopsis poae (strain ATCC 64411 / 73-15) TaxID=644358 RepID=A0A0C4E5L3_MAGP6|nr:hypothetical protein MAPG_07785 [Magnaporthiopsis poae ATCC 64411]
MAAETVTEKAVGLLDLTVEKDTTQVVVEAVDPDNGMKKDDDATGGEKLAKLLDRIQELEKSVEELKDAKGAKKNEAKEEAEDDVKSEAEKDAKSGAEDDAKSEAPFGTLLKVCLAPYDAKAVTSLIVTGSERLRSCAIAAFYAVPPSAVNNLEAWEEGSQTPGCLPSRVSINSKKILELLKAITNTTMNEAPCVMMPPFKLFATYWTEIEAKLRELQGDFVKKHKHEWSVRPDDETPRARPFKEDDAKEEAAKEKSTQDIQHLQCLVDFMAKYLHDIPTLREQIQTRQIESISFDDLWHLFNPGDIILGRAAPSGNRGQQAYQVFTVTKGRINTKEEGSRSKGSRERHDLRLQCFSLDYDGTKIDTLEEVLFIKPFIGTKRIADLDYYPKSFATDEEVENLQKRARRFIDNRYGHGRCEGITSRFETEHIDGEDVFVDFKSGIEEIPGEWQELRRFGVISPPECQNDETWESGCGSMTCTVSGCGNSIYLDEQVDIKRAEAARDKLAKAVPEDKIKTLKSMPERLLLLPRHLLVYTLRTKKWCFVDVRDFEKIVVTPEKIREGWKNLVIDPKHKRLLKAMVSDHAVTMSMDKKGAISKSGTSIDIVRGKGRGRIILLHGPPGVGKAFNSCPWQTSTAETIAAFTSPPRPLYPITCGDLGSNPEKIQKALESHFKLAHRWNCVLLLDEADVYLAERHHNDLDRNGIVSVFLRTLEYYSGILFLTSNRVGSIDLAFKSRIHMALSYKRIDLSGTREIWGNILDGIDKDNKTQRVKIDYDREDLLGWAVSHFEDMEKKQLPTWNGRQIRNAFQSAIALASHERLEKIRKKKMTEEQALKTRTLKDINLEEAHFNDVSEVVREFEDYLKECGKGDDKAEKEGLMAPEVKTVRAQAYGRGATGTARARAQQQKTTAQPRGQAAPASTSRNTGPRGASKNKRVATPVNRRDEEDDRYDDDNDGDRGDGDADAIEEENVDDISVVDVEVEENGAEQLELEDEDEPVEDGDDIEDECVDDDDVEDEY